MTLSSEILYRGALIGKRHWSVNDTFHWDPVQGCTLRKMSLTSQWQFWSSLLKMSLTGQWHFLRQSHFIWSWSKQRIIDLSFLLWTHHLWPNVIDHSQWQKFMDKTLKKMSLTMVNDKKIVIYWKWSIHWTDLNIFQNILILRQIKICSNGYLSIR